MKYEGEYFVKHQVFHLSLLVRIVNGTQFI